MSKIAFIPTLGFNVQPLVEQLEAAPWLWNSIDLRTASPASPHRELSDIWVRYTSVEDAKVDAPRPLVWHEAAAHLPAVFPIAYAIMERARATELGGILITRIPPGATCHPHADTGWHAKRYEKFAVQVKSAPGQAFCFEGESLCAAPGDVYWFDNAHEHWVVNSTDQERITLIVCVRAAGD